MNLRSRTTTAAKAARAAGNAKGKKRKVDAIESPEAKASNRVGEVARVLAPHMAASVIDIVAKYARKNEAEMLIDSMEQNMAEKKQKIDKQIKEDLPRELAAVAEVIHAQKATTFDKCHAVFTYPELMKIMPAFHARIRVLPAHGFCAVRFKIAKTSYYALYPTPTAEYREKVRRVRKVAYEGFWYAAELTWTGVDNDPYAD